MSKTKRYQATEAQGLPLGVLVVGFESLHEAMVVACALNTHSVNTRVLFESIEWCMVKECEYDYCVVKV